MVDEIAIWGYFFVLELLVGVVGGRQHPMGSQVAFQFLFGEQFPAIRIVENIVCVAQDDDLLGGRTDHITGHYDLFGSRDLAQEVSLTVKPVENPIADQKQILSLLLNVTCRLNALSVICV